MHTPSFISITGVGFVTNVAWGVIMPSLWAYLKSVDGKLYHLGIAVSIFSLAQFVFLQIFGKWADKRSMRECLMCSFIIGIGSYLLYASAHRFPDAVCPYIIIFARTLAGVEAGNLTITNSFVAVSTEPSQRTKYMAKMNGINVFGLIFCPFFNWALSYNFYLGDINMDQFVNGGVFVAVLHVVNIVMFIFLFKEPRIKPEEQSLLHPQINKKGKQKEIDGDKEEGGASMETIEPNKVHVDPKKNITKWQFVKQSIGKPYGVCFVACFVQNFIFAVVVTIITPITTSRYSFDPFKNSILFAAASGIMVLVIFVVAMAGTLVKHIDRVVILISQVFMAIGLVGIGILLVRLELSFPELCGVVILIVIGVPGQNTAISSIYSKFITIEYGVEKLGEYTGLLLQFGALGSVLGPLWAGFALSLSGGGAILPKSYEVLTAGLVFFLLISMLWTIFFFKSLILPTPLPVAEGERIGVVAKQAAKVATQRMANTGMTTVGPQQFAQYDAQEEAVVLDPQDLQSETGKSWVKAEVQYNSVKIGNSQ